MWQPVTDTGVTIINITLPLGLEDESSDNTEGGGGGGGGLIVGECDCGHGNDGRR